MSAGFESSSASEDFELARRVKLFLAHQPRPALRHLSVEVQSETVILRGAVTTYYERQLALQCSRRVAGVRGLIDEIVVQEIVPQPRADFSPGLLRSEQPLAAV